MDNTKQQQQTQSSGNVPGTQSHENTLVDFTASNAVKTASDAAHAKQPANITQNQQNVVQQQPVQIPQPPVGISHPKELEPMSSLSTVTEQLQPVEQHIELEPEVEAAGVEAAVSEPKITQEEKDNGVKLAKEAAVVEQEPVNQVQFPLSMAQAQQIVKGQLVTKDTSNPMLWLALLIIRQYQMHEKQKEKVK